MAITVSAELDIRCQLLIQKKFNNAETLAETANIIIKNYRKTFGSEAYQIIRLNDNSLMAILSVAVHQNEILLFGYEVLVRETEILYKAPTFAICSIPNPTLERAFVKMLISINKLKQ